jgi:TRAP-type C4-dicarboxylate transport system permease small subunit
MDLDWQTVPEGVRPALKAVVKAIGAAFLILMLVLVWNQWSRHRVGAQLVQAALIVLAFACESLFFAYGEVRMDREVS